MPPRRQKHHGGLSSQNPAVARPGKPTITTPSPTPSSTRIYYPETQLQNMESSARPRGGFVDQIVTFVLGASVDRNPETSALPAANASTTPLPKSDVVSGTSHDRRRRKRPTIQRGEEKQQHEKDPYLKHGKSHHLPDHNLKGLTTPDTHRDPSHIAKNHDCSATASPEDQEGAPLPPLEGEVKDRDSRILHPPAIPPPTTYPASQVPMTTSPSLPHQPHLDPQPTTTPLGLFFFVLGACMLLVFLVVSGWVSYCEEVEAWSGGSGSGRGKATKKKKKEGGRESRRTGGGVGGANGGGELREGGKKMGMEIEIQMAKMEREVSGLALAPYRRESNVLDEEESVGAMDVEKEMEVLVIGIFGPVPATELEG